MTGDAPAIVPGSDRMERVRVAETVATADTEERMHDSAHTGHVQTTTPEGRR
jgi:hypothetical protein